MELFLDMYEPLDFKRKWASLKAAEWQKDLFDPSSAFGMMASSEPVAISPAPLSLHKSDFIEQISKRERGNGR